METPAVPPSRPLIAAKAAILFATAAYLAYTIFSGNINNYINNRFAWLVYAAVALLVFLAVSMLLELRHGAARIRHTPVRLPSLMLMAVPLALALIPSRPLGAEAIDGGLQVGAATYSAASATLVNKDPLDRDVLDWSRLFMSESAPTAFNGQRASVLGFVYREPSYPEGTFMVARFTLSCCVADASALGLPARFDGAASLQDGQWVEVEGAFRAESFMGEQVPVIQASAVTPVDEPEQPYLYP